MRRLSSAWLAIAFTLVAAATIGDATAAWRGNAALEARYFLNEGLYSEQENFYPSVSMEAEYYHAFENSDYSLTITPFYRYDAIDDERTHGDFREFRLHVARGAWEWDVGLIKVFWGVTESRHLVDIINQTDQIENIDGEDKLGQPAVHGLWYRDWGTVELFLMPGFRERTFPGDKGRLRGPLAVDTDNASYESDDEDSHLDVALRLAGTVKDDWDVGLSFFSGTSREPDLVVDMSGAAPRLTPFYPLIDQIGLDVQATLDNWLWKLEAIHREQADAGFDAVVGGFEYTFYGIADGASDLGVLLEYHHDSRGKSAPTPFQNDVFVGARWALNDAQSTDFLAGGLFDVDLGSRSFRVEFNRRLGQNWKLTGEAQLFSQIDSEDIQYALRRDDFIQIELARYF